MVHHRPPHLQVLEERLANRTGHPWTALVGRMPIAERGVLGLKCVGLSDEVDLLWLKWPTGSDRCFLAVPLRVSSQGIILALPQQAIPEETLAEADEGLGDGLVGPHFMVEVTAQTDEEEPLLLQILIVEFAMAVRLQLDRKGLRTRRNAVGFGETLQTLPSFQELNTSVTAWIEGGAEARLEDYYTAAEEPMPPEPPVEMGAIVEQLRQIQQAMDQRFSYLEGRVNQVTARPGGERASPSMPGASARNEPERDRTQELLEGVRDQVRRPPPRMRDEPRRTGETAVEALMAAEGPARGSKEASTLDDFLKVALLKLLKGQKETKTSTWTPFLGRGRERHEWGRSERQLVFFKQGRPWHRSCGKAALSDEVSSRSLPRTNGTAHDESSGGCGVGALDPIAVCTNMPGGQIPHSRVLPRGIRPCPQAAIGEQAKASSSAGASHDGGARAVPDRRVLDCGRTPHRHGRTSLGTLGHAGSGGAPQTIRLYEALRSHLDRCPHQRAEGGGVAGQEEERRPEAKSQRSRKRWKGREQHVKPPAPGVREQHGSTQARRQGPLAWLEDWCRELKNMNLPLAKYFRSTFVLPEGTSKAPSKSTDLFPCPPPYPWVVEKPLGLGKSRRQRARWEVRRSSELWVNLMVCALSHEALSLEVAPLRGRCGVSLSSSQERMCSFLKSLSSSVVRLGSDASGSGLRLPMTADRLTRLRNHLSAFEELPYASRRRSQGPRDNSFTATQALPVIAERLSLPSEVRDLDPRPFLSPEFRKIYEDPDSSLKSDAEMPEPIRVKGTANRSELLKVMSRWDGLGRLFICKSTEVSPLDRCELFAVAKDVDKDRQILHRKRRNQRERHLAGASKNLPHGVLLCQLPLGKELVCACSVDDVKDFYHAYVASESRARSSPVGPFFRVSEVAHLKSCQKALAEGRIRKHDLVACCFQGLGMGDHAAVDIAQESHVNLIRTYGGMRSNETLTYRKPVPNTPEGFYEGIMIDDHLGVQLLKRQASQKATLAQPGRDLEAFGCAAQAYADTGLETHPKKRVRRGLHVKVWGETGAGTIVGPGSALGGDGLAWSSGPKRSRRCHGPFVHSSVGPCSASCTMFIKNRAPEQPMSRSDFPLGLETN